MTPPLLDLNPAHVRTLQEVVRRGSFSRAAEDLHLSQPAVSLHIRQLEDKVGLALVERVGKRASPTRAARSCSSTPSAPSPSSRRGARQYKICAAW